jgi:hypothetical protein
MLSFWPLGGEWGLKEKPKKINPVAVCRPAVKPGLEFACLLGRKKDWARTGFAALMLPQPIGTNPRISGP